MLESGVIPWRKPWVNGGAKNIDSRKPYQGINSLLLNCSEYSSPWWGTFKQIEKAGGKVRKGEKSSIVVFYSSIVKEDEKPMFVLRYYSVFNSEQCDGVKVPEEKENNEIVECQDIVDRYSGPKIVHGNFDACYRPSDDSVYMPMKNHFVNSERYYATMFHELIHSTGHESRLNRFEKKSVDFGSHEYSFEELVAEIGSAFLCAKSGIENQTIDHSAAYIQSWIKVFRNDKMMLTKAASNASKAVDFILGVK